MFEIKENIKIEKLGIELEEGDILICEDRNELKEDARFIANKFKEVENIIGIILNRIKDKAKRIENPDIRRELKEDEEKVLKHIITLSSMEKSLVEYEKKYVRNGIVDKKAIIK
jgi:hypothetical protein